MTRSKLTKDAKEAEKRRRENDSNWQAKNSARYTRYNRKRRKLDTFINLQQAITSIIPTDHQLDPINYAADLDETEGFTLENQGDVDDFHGENISENQRQDTDGTFTRSNGIY